LPARKANANRARTLATGVWKATEALIGPQGEFVSAFSERSVPHPQHRSRWRLWVDGCGGYLLLTGNRWSIGGSGLRSDVDIGLLADCPRRAGEIVCSQGDFFWDDGRKKSSLRRGSGRSVDATAAPVWITHGQTLPVPGSARVIFRQPSALCGSAVLGVLPPHRFSDHVDGVILVHDSFLIGPGEDCHIRCDPLTAPVIVTRRGRQWLAKEGPAGDFFELCVETRQSLPLISMTLEEA
jgi:hypothetical protein